MQIYSTSRQPFSRRMGSIGSSRLSDDLRYGQRCWWTSNNRELFCMIYDGTAIVYDGTPINCDSYPLIQHSFGKIWPIYRGSIVIYDDLMIIWRFPFRHRGTQIENHPFVGNFPCHEIHHQAMGAIPIFRAGNPHKPLIIIIPGWWFGCHQFYFPINIGSQLTFMFFRGVETTNQIIFNNSPLVNFDSYAWSGRGLFFFGGGWRTKPTDFFSRNRMKSAYVNGTVKR